MLSLARFSSSSRERPGGEPGDLGQRGLGGVHGGGALGQHLNAEWSRDGRRRSPKPPPTA